MAVINSRIQCTQLVLHVIICAVYWRVAFGRVRLVRLYCTS